MHSTLLLSLLVFLCFFSCTKDEMTQPVSVVLVMEMDQEHEVTDEDNEGAGSLLVTGGSYLIREVGFEGYREEGENYFFSRGFSAPLKLTFSREKEAQVLAFDMPKGNYKQIDLLLQVPEGKEPLPGTELIDRAKLQGGIEIWGTYTNSAGMATPFLFVYTALDQLKIKAQTASGNEQLLIKDKQAYQASIRFKPQEWMLLLNPSMLQDARLSPLEGVPTLVMSKTQNSQLYHLLAGRIKQSAHLIIE